jgi:3-hydroxy acid dehydrogenase/malonic semialdehyde reductase
MSTFQQKIILITGASSGIGKATAEAFAKLGAKLILVARRLDKLKLLQLALKDQYQTDCYIAELDIQNRSAITDFFQALPTEWCDVDILVNNAGLALKTESIQNSHPDDWDTMLNTNVRGLFSMTHTVLPGMLQRQQGHVINIGSISGRDCYPGGAVYCATKFAVKAFTKALRLDLNGTPLRVTEIAPGAVETEFSEVRWNDKAKAKAFYEDFHPLVAADIADAIVYCASRPQHVNIAEMVIYPTDQASITHIHRQNNQLK